MNPTASASPIALLTTVVDPAAMSAGASANAANNAANAEGDGDSLLLPSLSGGFQLLIDAAAQQLTATSIAPKTSPKTTVPANISAEEGGNVLPLLGALLPIAGDAAAAAQSAAGEDSLDADKTNADDKTAADQQTTDNTALQLLWAPVNVQPPAPPPTAAALNNVASADDSANAATNNVAALVLPAAPNPMATDSNTNPNALPLAGEQSAAVQSSGLQLNKQIGGDRNTHTQTDVLVASSNNATQLDVTPQDLIGATQKPSESASFADLLKPAQAAAANPLTALLESGRAQQAARPYAEMNSTAATVNVPVGNSGWSDAVLDKVMWFSANKLSSAEIQLNPPDLGPLQVRISTQHDQASVVFSSPHAAVRDALDQALPRLREMLGGQGIQLSDASVGGQNAQTQQQQAQQQNGERRSPTSGFFHGDDSGTAPSAVTRVQVPRLSTSAVDAYA